MHSFSEGHFPFLCIAASSTFTCFNFKYVFENPLKVQWIKKKLSDKMSLFNGLTEARMQANQHERKIIKYLAFRNDPEMEY